jgi:sec-independent protein translocase protein TatA
MPSGPEWIIVLVVVLVIFGGSQLPKLARNLGKAQKEFKDGLAEGEREATANKRTGTAVTDTTARDAADAPAGEAAPPQD